MSLPKILFIVFSLASLISCTKNQGLAKLNEKGSRAPSSTMNCLEATYSSFRQSIHLSDDSNYWAAASIFCQAPNERELTRIINFHNTLRQKSYFKRENKKLGASDLPPLLISIYLNGDQEKLNCLSHTIRSFKDSNYYGLINKLNSKRKYLIAARICSQPN